MPCGLGGSCWFLTGFRVLSSQNVSTHFAGPQIVREMREDIR
jgi:hypothetical protein